VGQVADAYSRCRARISGLVRDLDDQTAATAVPACPDWSVHDVVAHLAGVVADALAGRMNGVTTDRWTAAQVAARRGRPLTDLLESWDSSAPRFEALLDAAGRSGRQAVADIVSHEHDIRGALRQPGARQSDAVAIGIDFVATAFTSAAEASGIGVGVRTTAGQDFGPADAPAVLTGEPFELLRALTGRRSAAQLLQMTWTGDAGQVLPAFSYGPFRPAATAIKE
jgi:uncharacterized protein (TIGR03083 family)